ncbi:MAG: ABC transporter permease [Candidatus Brockarchaeota archaeon]|nr:ABC transporter permease [Candidatus Brockarchaeota archaeon]
MQIRVEKRIVVSKGFNASIRIFTLLLSLVLVGILFAIYGINPLEAYARIFMNAFGSEFGLSETIVKMLPIGLCATGLAIAYKARVLNIGAEGQLILGAMAATWIALYSNIPSSLVGAVMLLAGFAAGALWAAIPAVLKIKLNVNEVITTLMMNYISLELLDYVLTGPWKGPSQRGFPLTDPFPSYARFPLIGGTRIHYYTLILLLVLAIILYVFMSRTRIGYEIKIVGSNPEAARYAGINVSKNILTVMLISGGLAGIAGVGEVAGVQGRLIENISPGYGYTAIIPAWLGGLNPLAALLASFFISGLMVGSDSVQVSLRLRASFVDVFNGMILLFFIGSEILTRYRILIEARGRKIWI